jgi:preprotein translocase subunit SecD
VREELKRKHSVAYSVENGFDSAFATITDSNITTLIVALLLYNFGSGAIKGFAVALSVGIVSSMFSAIVITKLLIDLWMKYTKPKDIYPLTA